jgi:hypothetical protein
MSTHLERHRAAMEKLAYPAVEQFIAQHPEYAITPNQSGSQSATNYVIFGQRGQEQVIFKYFCEDERKAREVYALRHFAKTGVVPNLLQEHDTRLIVQSRIPGGWLPNPGDPDYGGVDTHRVGYTLGQAVAMLLNVPLTTQAARDYESTFYEGLPLEKYFGEILDASWLIHRNVAAYASPLFANSLQTIEANLPYILAQKRLLYHQDAMNMHFAESNFTGFFDLEMCRVGTAAMQIGSLWTLFATHNNWRAFAQGYAEHLGRLLDEADFNAARAFAHFLVWRYVSRYGRWRAEPDSIANRTQAEGDAAMYAKSLDLNNNVLFYA